MQILGALKRNSQTLAQFTAELTLFPQVLENVRLDNRFDFAKNRRVQDAVQQAEVELAGDGRVLLRASGTEPVIRVMVEGRNAALVKELAVRIAADIKEAAAA